MDRFDACDSVTVAVAPRVLNDGLVAVLDVRGVRVLGWLGAPEDAPCGSRTLLMLSAPLRHLPPAGAVLVVPADLHGPDADLYVGRVRSQATIAGLPDLLAIVDRLVAVPAPG